MIPSTLPLAACRTLLGAALLLALAASAHAQGTDEQREACTPDALKLCSDTIPDIPKTTACMKAHEAALSPRCRAVFNEPATKEPAVAAASKAVEARREKHAKREAAARKERESSTSPRHHRETSKEVYADPLGTAHDDAGNDEERPLSPGGAADEAYGPDIRRFAPGDGPDEAGATAGPAPYGYDPYADGPPSVGPDAMDRPRGWDGPRFADRDDPSGYDGPRSGRGGPRDFDGPPGFGRDDGPGGEADRRSRHAGQPARTVIARLCARGEIDPHTCAVTERALRREPRD